MKDKFILDACCGGRCFWFNKHHPNCIYIDNRKREHGHTSDRPNHTIIPDEIGDFRNLKYPDNTFKLVVFDPPHLIGKEDASIILKKYGALNKDTWREDIKKGFDECWRVLDDYGVLIFKWSEIKIKHKEVLEILDKDPLFGHPTLSRANAKWFCFMKIPEEKQK